MKYLPLAFSSVNWCKIEVFTSNIMVLHHKMPQIVKIKVNRYTNIYLLVNLFKINQFIFIFSCISALLLFIQQKNFFNHFLFLLLLIVWDFLWCKGIIFKVKTSISHQFTELKASGRYFIPDRIYYGQLFIGSKLILVQRIIVDRETWEIVTERTGSHGIHKVCFYNITKIK